MIPVSFPQANSNIGHPDAFDLPVYVDKKEYVSCWQLSSEDLERINKTGRIYLRITGPHPLVSIQTEDPFLAPNPIGVHEAITDRVFLLYHGTDELVVLRVLPNEKNFKVYEHKISSGELRWCLEFDRDGEHIHDETQYFFAEPVTVIGKISETYGNYDDVAERQGWKKDEVLVMERVTKTQ
jgi:hypothetical protein